MKPLLKRPFAFWLPAFGLLFLLWAWVDSCYHDTSGYIGYRDSDSNGAVSIGLHASALLFRSDHVSGERMPGSSLSAAGRRDKVPPHHATWWFPRPDLGATRESFASSTIPGVTAAYTGRFLSIPVWCLVPAYLALWRALVARRGSLRLTSTPPIQPSPPAQPQSD